MNTEEMQLVITSKPLLYFRILVTVRGDQLCLALLCLA